MKGWRHVAASAAGLLALIVVAVGILVLRDAPSPSLPRHEGVVVRPEPRVRPVLVRAQQPVPPRSSVAKVRGALEKALGVDFDMDVPLIRRRRSPVSITMYCLKGTTRRGNPVRDGIIATDPTVIPLGSVVDLYVGLRYKGRFLADDTGRLIKGNKIDVWTPSCPEAIQFGRRRGAIVMVELPPPKKPRARR